MPKKIPQRMCIACRQMKDKGDLCRVVRDAEGRVFLDASYKASGRGAYLCKSMGCLDKAIKTKALSRAFKCDISSEILESLRLDLSK